MGKRQVSEVVRRSMQTRYLGHLHEADGSLAHLRPRFSEVLGPRFRCTVGRMDESVDSPVNKFTPEARIATSV